MFSCINLSTNPLVCTKEISVVFMSFSALSQMSLAENSPNRPKRTSAAAGNTPCWVVWWWWDDDSVVVVVVVVVGDDDEVVMAIAIWCEICQILFDEKGKGYSISIWYSFKEKQAKNMYTTNHRKQFRKINCLQNRKNNDIL